MIHPGYLKVGGPPVCEQLGFCNQGHEPRLHLVLNVFPHERDILGQQGAHMWAGCLGGFDGCPRPIRPAVRGDPAP